MKHIFTPEFFEKHDYTMSVPNSKEPDYIEAHSKHVWDYSRDCPKSVVNKRMIRMNTKTGYIAIKEDWDTRTVFSGQVCSAEQLSVILSCVC